MPLVIPTAHFLIFLAFNWLLLSLIVHFWWARKRPYPFPTGDCGSKSVALSFLNPTDKNDVYYAIGKIRDREFKGKVKRVLVSAGPNQEKIANKVGLVNYKITQIFGVKAGRGKSLELSGGRKAPCFICPTIKGGAYLDPSVDVSDLKFTFSGKKKVDPLKPNILGVLEEVGERRVAFSKPAKKANLKKDGIRLTIKKVNPKKRATKKGVK